MIRPLLFILFINQLNTDIEASESYWVFVCEIIEAIRLLLLADDTDLVQTVW